MRRIPYEGRKKVSQNLVPVKQVGFARFGKPPIIFSVQVSWSLKGLQETFHNLFHSSIDIPLEESKFFARRATEETTIQGVSCPTDGAFGCGFDARSMLLCTPFRRA